MKKYFLAAIQIFITGGLLWWIFRDPEKNRQMWEALGRAQVSWVAIGFVAIGVAFLLQTQRWLILMKVQGIHLQWWRAWRLVMIGAFFNLFLLGATGGDVIKIFYALRETATKKSAAFLSVLVDRVIGLLALIAVAVVICFINFSNLMEHPLTRALLGSLVVILGGSLFVILAGVVVDRLHLTKQLPSWMPMHTRILELASAFSVYTRDLQLLFSAFIISVAVHIFIFSSFYCAARAFTEQLTLGDVFSVMPIINTLTALPISFSGLGVREQLFQRLFETLYGIPGNIAVVISLIGFSLLLAWGLLGGVVYLFYRPSGIKLKDMEREISAIEAEITPET